LQRKHLVLLRLFARHEDVEDVRCAGALARDRNLATTRNDANKQSDGEALQRKRIIVAASGRHLLHSGQNSHSNDVS
jgi:hypothetical protein